MPSAVIDTCVVIDMLMSTRPRHPQASRLRRELIRVNVVAKLPMFAIFEINHATRQEQRLSRGKLVTGADTGGFSVDFVPVDEAFVKKYFDVNLPEMRAGDLLFASLAKGEGLPLITEDLEFAKIAKTAGIRVLSTSEYEQELATVAV